MIDAVHVIRTMLVLKEEYDENLYNEAMKMLADFYERNPDRKDKKSEEGE